MAKCQTILFLQGESCMVGPYVIRHGPDFLDALMRWMPSNWKIPGIFITGSPHKTQDPGLSSLLFKR